MRDLSRQQECLYDVFFDEVHTQKDVYYGFSKDHPKIGELLGWTDP